MAENNSDYAHFMYVHGSPAMPEAEVFTDGHYKRVTSPRMNELGGVFLRESFGLGLGVLHVGDVLVFLSSTTPIDDEHVHVRWVFTAPKSVGEMRTAMVRIPGRRAAGRADLEPQDLPRATGIGKGRWAHRRVSPLGSTVLFIRRLRASAVERARMTSPITDFTDRVAVVTGGASGIGRAIGEALARAGARVVLADVEKGALDGTVAELAAATGAQIDGIVCDVSDGTSVEHLAEEVFARHGATHLLINNAGVGAPSAKVWETTPNDWHWTYSVNVMGVAFGVLAFVPRMLASGEPGYVVNTSSGDGAIAPMPMASVYASSKAAVATITECLAIQLAQEPGQYAASLFLPGGKGLLATGLWTADRNRPDHLAREKPRSTAAVTIETLKEMAAKQGRELPIQPLDELAEHLLDGIRAGTYCISMNLEANAATLRERADRFGRGEIPAQLDHGGLLG